MLVQSLTRYLVVALLLSGSAAFPFNAGAQTMADYTSFPTFVTDTVASNILVVYDTSASMNRMAYDGQTYSNANTYEGIFEVTECYNYDGAAGKFVPDLATANGAGPPSSCPAGYAWSGNLLNFVTMRRADIAKWALIGGQCTTGGRDAQGKCTTTLEGLTENGSARTISVAQSSVNNLMPSALVSGDPVDFRTHKDARLEVSSTYHNIVVDVSAPAGGIVQDVGDRARVGFMRFTDQASDGAKLLADIGSDPQTIATLLDAITNPGGVGTPLAEALFEATRYLAQLPPYYHNGHYNYTDITRDPYYFVAPKWASASAYVSCCDSYIIMLTDGEATNDTTVPNSIKGLADGIGGGSGYLDDVSYWTHTTDIRDGTVATINETGKDLAGSQNVTVFTFFAFGSGSTLLQTAAKFGGFQDINGNNEPDLQDEWDQADNLTGAATPDGVPDNYFESSNAQDIKDRMTTLISAILQRSGSGSAASVLASSSTGEGAVYQAYFYPSTVEGLKDIKWTGHTHGLFLDAFGNLREDTVADGRLVYEEDQIVRTRFDAVSNQVLVDRYNDADADGLPDTTSPVGAAVELRRANSIWEAGERLANMNHANRNIYTWIDEDNDKVVDAAERIQFTSANATKLAPYLRPGASPYTAANIIQFIRGEQVSGLRNRQLTVGGTLKVWKMGDPIHSRPITVGGPAQRYDVIYGDTTYSSFFAQYKDRRQVVYVGANDGMLHAFNAGFYHRGDDPATTTKTEHGYFTTTQTGVTNTPPLGDELFGFIPQEVLPHLKWLTQPDYTHVYYVDLTPKVTDARIFTPDTDHPDGWGTILMGGLRFGGSCNACPAGNGLPMSVTADFDYNGATADTTRDFYSVYFVLDITNPESANYPKLLWSFSSADLGFASTVPSMLRVSPTSSATTDNTDAKWFMVVGSGPTGYDGRTTQAGKLYAIDLAQGPGANNANVTTMPAESLNAFMGTPVSIDRNFDYRVDVLYMGSVIDDTAPPWRGKLYRLTMRDCLAAPCVTSTWGIAAGTNRAPSEVLDTFPASNAINLGPIASTPAVAIDDSDKLWIFAGTGRNYDSIDKTNTDTQHFVGVKDSVLNGTCTETTATGCHANDLVDVSGAQVCLLGVGNCGGTTNQVTGVTGLTDQTLPGLVQLVKAKDGWYTTLPATGERMLVRPIVIAGLVLFPTFSPTNNSACTTTGDSYLYALYYLTGSAYSSPVIGTTASGSNKNINRSTNIGSGMSSQVVVHIGSGSSGGKGTAYIQKSTADMTKIEFDAAGMALTSRFMTWYATRD